MRGVKVIAAEKVKQGHKVTSKVTLQVWIQKLGILCKKSGSTFLLYLKIVFYSQLFHRYEWCFLHKIKLEALPLLLISRMMDLELFLLRSNMLKIGFTNRRFMEITGVLTINSDYLYKNLGYDPISFPGCKSP